MNTNTHNPINNYYIRNDPNAVVKSREVRIVGYYCYLDSKLRLEADLTVEVQWQFGYTSLRYSFVLCTQLMFILNLYVLSNMPGPVRATETNWMLKIELKR